MRASCNLWRKYGLGSLSKTRTEGTPPVGPDPTSGKLVLNLRPNANPRRLRQITKVENSCKTHGL